MPKRGKLRLTVDVKQKQIVKAIEKQIKSGIEKAARRRFANSVSDTAVDAAKDRIRQEGAIWRGELIESFDVTTRKVGSNWVIEITNDADHAKPLDEGAEYDEKGPPIAELIPWVESNLGGFDGDVELIFDG
jgi:hypothetical protein